MSDSIIKDSRTKNYVSLNQASIVMGIIVIILCFTDWIPKEFATPLLYCMPLLLFVNYAALYLLCKKPGYMIK